MDIETSDPEATRLIHRLAELTGGDETQAAVTAVREKIERVRSDRSDRAERTARIRRIVDEIAAALQDLPGHGGYLYDRETGLPK